MTVDSDNALCTQAIKTYICRIRTFDPSLPCVIEALYGRNGMYGHETSWLLTKAPGVATSAKKETKREESRHRHIKRSLFCFQKEFRAISTQQLGVRASQLHRYRSNEPLSKTPKCVATLIMCGTSAPRGENDIWKVYIVTCTIFYGRFFVVAKNLIWNLSFESPVYAAKQAQIK